MTNVESAPLQGTSTQRLKEEGEGSQEPNTTWNEDKQKKNQHQSSGKPWSVLIKFTYKQSHEAFKNKLIVLRDIWKKKKN